MKIGESSPSPKRSAKVTLRAASVSAVCMTAFGSPVVLEVNIRWSSPSAEDEAPAVRAAGARSAARAARSDAGAGSRQRRVPSSPVIATAGERRHFPAAARAISPISVRPCRSTVTRARAPQRSAA